MGQLHQQQKDDLESLIDVYGLDMLAAALADICIEKAVHVRTNWQDAALGRIWERAAKAAQKLQDAAAELP